MRKTLLTTIAILVMFSCAAAGSVAQELSWDEVKVSFSPRSLNLGSNGRWVNCKISNLPDEYLPSDIDMDTVCIVEVNGLLLAEDGGPICARDSGGKHNNRSKNKLKVKFDRRDLSDAITDNPGDAPDNATITVEAYGLDGLLQIYGEDTIKVKPAKVKKPKKNK